MPACSRGVAERQEADRRLRVLKAAVLGAWYFQAAGCFSSYVPLSDHRKAPASLEQRSHKEPLAQLEAGRRDALLLATGASIGAGSSPSSASAMFDSLASNITEPKFAFGELSTDWFGTYIDPERPSCRREILNGMIDANYGAIIATGSDGIDDANCMKARKKKKWNAKIKFTKGSDTLLFDFGKGTAEVAGRWDPASKSIVFSDGTKWKWMY
eukprot:TRINITY_DN30569_c0_g1_i1.p1 TRINITY_DN30569_c0_g1~~TRINITY_DN30569_c0_g1_i1.p1  ORF type:complete len:213 (-),score=41.91 TRINITY_DN30569_c0_g1_i1:102-740(-)